ncbi:hypothetical protein, partial [Gemmiger formicilis]|uniref:hypothetical protein n=1 Tax=Gemmiger formicilis TaxID=745368 RepID=UPI0019595157
TFFALAVGGIAGIYYGFHIYTTFRYFVGGLPTLPGALPLISSNSKILACQGLAKPVHFNLDGREFLNILRKG